jgi:hypothetical protein
MSTHRYEGQMAEEHKNKLNHQITLHIAPNLTKLKQCLTCTFIICHILRVILSVNAHSSQTQTQPPIKTAAPSVLHLTVNKWNKLHVTTGLNMLHFTYYIYQCKTAACGNKMALPQQNLVIYI